MEAVSSRGRCAGDEQRAAPVLLTNHVCPGPVAEFLQALSFMENVTMGWGELSGRLLG